MPSTNENSPPLSAVAPLLSVRRGIDAIDFYKTAFGATEIFRIDSGGSVVCQLAVGASQFWVADESPEHNNFSPETLGGSTTRLILTVGDPDAVFAAAIAAGAIEVAPVEDQRYGWRVGRVIDPCGHHWEIARPLT